MQLNESLRILACGLCGLEVCARCHAQDPRGSASAHVCKEEDVSSVQMIMHDTKPCPTCGVRIHRAFGCDQMFCTSCTALFSWSTGQLVTKGPRHNPHYLDWMSKQRAKTKVGPASHSQKPENKIRK